MARIRSRPAATVLRVPPVAWMVRLWNVVALDDAVFLLHAADLEHLAAEPDHQRRADVGIGGVAPLRAHQRVEALALGGDAAAGAVHERDDAVDVRVVGEESGAFDLLRDQPRDRRRAIHRGQDREIVARADLAVGARESPERSAAPRRARSSRGARPRRNDSRARTPSPRNCARAPSRPAAIGLRGEADDLPEFAHRRARLDRAQPPSCGPSGRARERLHAFRRRRAGGDLVDRDDDVVGRVEAQSARRLHDVPSMLILGCLWRKELGLLARKRFETARRLCEVALHRLARARRVARPRSPRRSPRARRGSRASGSGGRHQSAGALARDGRARPPGHRRRAPCRAARSGSGGTRRRGRRTSAWSWSSTAATCSLRLAASASLSARLIRRAASAAISPSSALRMKRRSRTSLSEMRATNEPCCGATSTSRS